MVIPYVVKHQNNLWSTFECVQYFLQMFFEALEVAFIRKVNDHLPCPYVYAAKSCLALSSVLFLHYPGLLSTNRPAV